MKKYSPIIRRFRYVRIAVIIMIACHLLVLGFSSYYFFQSINEKTSLKTATHAANIIRNLLVANKYGHVESSLKQLNEHRFTPGFSLSLQKTRPMDSLALPPQENVSLDSIKKMVDMIDHKGHLMVTVYLKNNNQWLTIYSPDNLIYSTGEISFRMALTIVLPALVTITLIYFLFLLYKQLLITLIAKRIRSNESNPEEEEACDDPLKELQKEVKELKQRIKGIINEETLMLIALSHDINTPIMKLRLHAEDIVNDDTKHSVKRELDYLKNVVDSSIAISKESTLKKRKIDLTSLLYQIKVNRYNKDNFVVFNYPEIPIPICGAPALIKRAVINLIENSLKYAKKVNVDISKTGETTTISITDDGPGLPENEIERLLKPFQQLADSHQGTGLGLAIVNRIMEMHGGKMEIKNIEPHGLKIQLHF